MYGGKYLECIIIYYALDIRVPKKTSFRSKDINLGPWRESEIFLLNSSFDSKRDTAGDYAYSRYSNLSSPNVNITINWF